MSTIAEEREALATILQTNYPTWNVYAYWPDTPTTPCMLIKPDNRVYATQDGGVNRRYDIEVLLHSGSSRDAQISIDTLLDEEGPLSFKVMLEDNPTLNGVVENSNYIGWSRYSGRRTEAAAYQGVIVQIEVYA